MIILSARLCQEANDVGAMMRSHQWGEEMKRMQKTSRKRAEIERANAELSNR